jgi:hypothetical protein
MGSSLQLWSRNRALSRGFARKQGESVANGLGAVNRKTRVYSG